MTFLIYQRTTLMRCAGYDTGYISSVLVTLGTSLGHELSSSEAELVKEVRGRWKPVLIKTFGYCCLRLRLHERHPYSIL